jgi:hypothetical protein
MGNFGPAWVPNPSEVPENRPFRESKQRGEEGFILTANCHEGVNTVITPLEWASSRAFRLQATHRFFGGSGFFTWFQQADTDTNGALSEVELRAALKQIFPVPQPPPGFPPPPEDSGLHNLLATQLMASVDSNQDGWMTFKEAVAFVGQGLPQWDLDGSGSLDASEFANAFAQSMPPPPQSLGIGVSGSADGKFFRTFRAP